MAETAIRSAMEQLTNDRKIYDRDLSVLLHIRSADDALADTMQPNNAIQKAFDEIQEAKRFNPEIPVMINRVESNFQAVTPELIQKTAQEYLRPTNRTILTIVPKS